MEVEMIYKKPHTTNSESVATPQKGVHSEVTSVMGQRESTQGYDMDDDG